MRLWSIHPKYLDSKGLVALWREGLLAKAVLQGKTKGYRNHPQLIRFRGCDEPGSAINTYLWHVRDEALRRGFSFDGRKVKTPAAAICIAVTEGQLACESRHLLNKLKARDPQLYRAVRKALPLDSHPMLQIIAGPQADWERQT